MTSDLPPSNVNEERKDNVDAPDSLNKEEHGEIEDEFDVADDDYADDVEYFNSLEYFLLRSSIQITLIAFLVDLIVASAFLILGCRGWKFGLIVVAIPIAIIYVIPPIIIGVDRILRKTRR